MEACTRVQCIYTICPCPVCCTFSTIRMLNTLCMNSFFFFFVYFTHYIFSLYWFEQARISCSTYFTFFFFPFFSICVYSCSRSMFEIVNRSMSIKCSRAKNFTLVHMPSNEIKYLMTRELVFFLLLYSFVSYSRNNFACWCFVQFCSLPNIQTCGKCWIWYCWSICAVRHQWHTFAQAIVKVF